MKQKKAIIHNEGTRLIMTANRFFFNRKTHAKIEQMRIATGYNVIIRTKEVFHMPIPASKLINDIPQMTTHGIKESKYKIWLIIK